MTTKFGVPQNSSGVSQTIPVPSSQWVDPNTGVPTPQFFDLIHALLQRSGGESAPGHGGSVGITYVSQQAAGAQNAADSASNVAGFAYFLGTEANQAAQAATAAAGAEPLGALAYLTAIEAQTQTQTASVNLSQAQALPFLLYPPADVPKAQVSTGGGYNAGTPPTVIQSAVDASNTTGSITLGSAPANGNLLVAMSSGSNYNGAASGWTVVGSNGGGSDNLYIYTKTAGASESTTQTPCSNVAGGLILWELHGQSSTAPILSAQGQAEVNGATMMTAPQIYNLKNTICLSAMFEIGGLGTSPSVRNVGAVDVNTISGTRCVAAGHGTLADTPYGGVIVIYSGSVNAKGGTIQITS